MTTLRHAYELFHCERLHVRLSRESCAARHKKANAHHARGLEAYSSVPFTESQCRGCPIGAAHRRGEKPRVRVATVEIHRREDEMGATVKCLECGRTFERRSGPAKRCDECRHPEYARAKAAGSKATKTSMPPPVSYDRADGKPRTPAGSMAAAQRVVDVLQPLTAGQRRKALRIAALALDLDEEHVA